MNGILDALGMYFFHVERLRPSYLPEQCYPNGGYPGDAGYPVGAGYPGGGYPGGLLDSYPVPAPLPAPLP